MQLRDDGFTRGNNVLTMSTSFLNLPLQSAPHPVHEENSNGIGTVGFAVNFLLPFYKRYCLKINDSNLCYKILEVIHSETLLVDVSCIMVSSHAVSMTRKKENCKAS